MAAVDQELLFAYQEKLAAIVETMLATFSEHKLKERGFEIRRYAASDHREFVLATVGMRTQRIMIEGNVVMTAALIGQHSGSFLVFLADGTMRSFVSDGEWTEVE